MQRVVFYSRRFCFYAAIGDRNTRGTVRQPKVVCFLDRLYSFGGVSSVMLFFFVAEAGLKNREGRGDSPAPLARIDSAHGGNRAESGSRGLCCTHA